MHTQTSNPSEDGTAVSDGQRLQQLKDAGVDTLVIGAADINGVFRSKRFALDLFSREEVEVAFSDYVFASDLTDELMVPRPGYEGYFPTAASGLPDIYVHPDWDLLRILPWEPEVALVLGDFHGHDGSELVVSPRGVLRRVIDRLRGLGFEPMAGAEYEFFVFKCPPEEAAADPSKLIPLSIGPAYSHTRAAADERVLGVLRRMINAAGIPVEAANPEAAQGQSEITIRYSDALSAADNAFLYRHFIQELAAREGLTASFIAKIDPQGYGSSGHLHVSLTDLEGEQQMLGDDGELTDTARQAIAGFLETMGPFTSFYAPVINSYRRYQTDYAFAGDTIAWGYDNRTCGLRVIKATPGSTRIESRTPGADLNPYIALAATLAGFGHGIEAGLEPPAPIPADAYTASGVGRVPNDLGSATRALEDSSVAADWLGEEFVNFYVETRFWETEQHRLAVTDWELRRYL
ncbi:MAG: glutamine synthetase family protein [Solirubrobacterales bacterium]